MKLVLDTADINPSLFAKVGGSYDQVLAESCTLTSGPVRRHWGHADG